MTGPLPEQNRLRHIYYPSWTPQPTPGGTSRSVGSEFMDIEQVVALHYAHGSLEQAILDALAAAGKDVNRLTLADLAPVDEFHIGGRPATVEFAGQFGVHGGMRLLDVGCGLGGAARYFAHEHGCQVTGIDLSGEYVAFANALAAPVRLGGLLP